MKEKAGYDPRQIGRGWTTKAWKQQRYVGLTDKERKRWEDFDRDYVEAQKPVVRVAGLAEDITVDDTAVEEPPVGVSEGQISTVKALHQEAINRRAEQDIQIRSQAFQRMSQSAIVGTDVG